jgi:hypothetical protein
MPQDSSSCGGKAEKEPSLHPGITEANTVSLQDLLPPGIYEDLTTATRAAMSTTDSVGTAFEAAGQEISGGYASRARAQEIGRETGSGRGNDSTETGGGGKRVALDMINGKLKLPTGVTTL